MSKHVVVLDYGSGNVRSAVRALEKVGALVELTADPGAVLGADGLFVPGVGNFHACMEGLLAAQGPLLIGRRLAGSRPVLGYAAHDWSLHPTSRAFEEVAPIVTHATHGERFVAAVENGPLSGTQFHPEKSGEAGLTLLENWIRSL